MAPRQQYEVNLVPPVGTSFYKSYTYSLPTAGTPPYPNISVTFYIYVTAVQPTDADFTAKGGRVYIIAAYNGSAKAYYNMTIGGTNYQIPTNFNFGVEDSSGALSRMDQQPYQASQDGWYTINFQQTMSMFNNGGNSPFSFATRYLRTYSLPGFSQSTSGQTGWKLDYTPDSGTDEDNEPVTYGLQLFQSNKLTVAKCKLNANFYKFNEELIPFTQEFNLDFSAETMAKAVVGG